jgi:adenine C2-methylase RlmN of 23S rRNA A2503 and tRNA A37
MTLEFLEIIKSKTENVSKYLFRCNDRAIIEFSYINKDDGKDIICTPCETMCNLACKFCHTTDYIGRLKHRKLTAAEIYDGVKYVYAREELEKAPKTLLVSFMGCGEPIKAHSEVLGAMCLLKGSVKVYTRFAIATCLPSYCWADFFTFTNLIKKNELQVKLHISLHYTMDQIRREWMPAALDIIPTLSAADFYKKDEDK